MSGGAHGIVKNRDMVKIRSSYRHKNVSAIPFATFKRLVKEITDDVMLEKYPHKWSEKALKGLHEEAETYLAEHFAKANYMRETQNKKTLDAKHFCTAKVFS